MTKYRNGLPQLGDRPFLTDGGIETTLIFHEGLDLPHFAAFHLFETDAGASHLRNYFKAYAEMARPFGVGLMLESPHGVPAGTGETGWATRPTRWPMQTAIRQRDLIQAQPGPGRGFQRLASADSRNPRPQAVRRSTAALPAA